MIPYVIIFENNTNNDKIDDDIYSTIETIKQLKQEILDIVSEHLSHYEKDEYEDFGSFCEHQHQEAYNDDIYFTVRYFVNDEWYELKNLHQFIDKHWESLQP